MNLAKNTKHFESQILERKSSRFWDVEIEIYRNCTNRIARFVGCFGEHTKDMRKSVARGTALVRAHSLLAVASRSDDISRSGLNCMASLERSFVVELTAIRGSQER